MDIIKFNQVYTSEMKPYMQSNGSSVRLPDGRTVYANKAYMNKLFKDSGYRGVRVVDAVYDIVGDTTAMDYLKLDDNVIVTDDDSNFIYLKKSSYAALSKIIDYIESKYKIKYTSGDMSDCTQFALLFRAGIQEYVLQVNLIKEWAYLYGARHHSDNCLHPIVYASYNLYDEGASDIIIQAIVEDTAVPLDMKPPKNLSISDLIYLLESTGLIKYNKKKNAYVSKSENDNVINELLPYLEKINTCKWRYRYTTPVNVVYSALLGDINNWYHCTVEILDEDVPFDICKYLWNYTQFSKVVED